MNGETPKFFATEKDLEIYSSESSFYSLLMKTCKNKDELSPKHKTKRHIYSLSKINKKKKKTSPTKKIHKTGVSEPKGKFAKFLIKRFKLRNDYDEHHVNEFLSSKEQAFEIPSRDGDIIY